MSRERYSLDSFLPPAMVDAESVVIEVWSTASTSSGYVSLHLSKGDLLGMLKLMSLSDKDVFGLIKSVGMSLEEFKELMTEEIVEA